MTASSLCFFAGLTLAPGILPAQSPDTIEVAKVVIKVAPKTTEELYYAFAEGDRIILWAVNRPEWGIAIFSIAHLGAVSVPLDVRHTVDFGRKIVAQTGAKLVIASRQTEASARELGLPILFVETLPDLARKSPPVPRPSNQRSAEIVFTSGTTSEPGGDAQSRQFLASATTMMQVLSFGPQDRLLGPAVAPVRQVLGFMAP
jgi:long-subunit acyl-CoA synthetase (AMP-forming)